MRFSKFSLSGPGFAAAIGAGLTAALFSMLVAQRTSLSFAMYLVAPLPIMIAALGFGTVAGVIALAVGALAVGAFDVGPQGLTLADPANMTVAGIDALVFIVGLGIPAVLLARLTAVVPASTEARSLSTVRRPEEDRLGRLMAVAVGFAAVAVAMDFAVTIARQGGFAASLAKTAADTEPFVKSMLATNRKLPEGLTVHDVAVVFTWARLPVWAGIQVVRLVFNLWLAARIAQTSGLFSATWPDIARYARMPRPLALVLAVVLGLSFAGGLPGMAALIVSGAILTGFALQGLAVIHAVTRGKTYRLPLLIIVYLSMSILPSLIVFYGILGLLDTAFAFRDREKKPAPKPGPWQQPPR